MNLFKWLKYSFKSRRYYDKEDLPRRLCMQILAVATIVAGGAYIGWAVLNQDPSHPVIGWVYVAAESVCLLIFILAAVAVWHERFKRPEGLSPDQSHSVDIFVPTCGEPLHVVETTLRAVKNVEWDGPLEVYVLDDAARGEVEDVAGELGFTYLCGYNRIYHI